MKYIILRNANPELYEKPIAIDRDIIITFFAAENEGKKATILYAGEKGSWQVLDDFETVASLMNG